MRMCSKCEKILPLDNFGKCGFTSKGTQRYRAECLTCKGSRDRVWAKDNRHRYKESHAARIKKHDRVNREYVLAYLKDNPCVDCGEPDPIVLEFDHVRGNKVTSISYMLQRHSSLSKIIEEIKKCDVRCANCHRRVTAARGNYWKHTLKI